MSEMPKARDDGAKKTPGPGAGATPPSAPDSEVVALARRAGLAVDWQDAQGRKQRVSEATLERLLERLGLPCGSAAQVRRSLGQLDAEAPERRLPPLITAQADRVIELRGGGIRPGTRYRIEFEQGGGLQGFASAPRGDTTLISPISEIGYHTLFIDDKRCRLAVAPARCFSIADATADKPRLWAVGAQVYGLRRTGDGGAGDYTALAELARSAAAHGAHALAISPVHAMFSAQPEKYSPYSPSSRLFSNVLHADFAQTFGQTRVDAALREADLGETFAQLESLPLIDWPAFARAKLALARQLFDSFVGQPPDAALQQEFKAFCAAGGQALTDHARFEALQAHRLADDPNDGYWRKWPEALRDARSEAVERFAEAHRAEVDFHLFLQWLAQRGLAAAQAAARDAGMPIGLIADLAVGCDSAGSHAWSYRDDMLEGVSVGAPPDLFNQAGQAWGLTTFSPRAMVNQGFSAFIDMLRAAFTYAGGVRIDHVLGLRRLWLVPEGAPASEGAYLNYPFDDLMRLIALESWRHRAVVIGEDLGTVPEGFRDRLASAGLLGMSVLWFQRQPAEDGAGFIPPAAWSPHALAMTTTHDLPTIAGWWSGSDIEWRARVGQTPADGVAAQQAEREVDRGKLWQALLHAGCAGASKTPDAAETRAAPQRSALPDAPPIDAALQYVTLTPAPLVSYPLEDLLGLVEQPNLPGSIDEHPNWRQRMQAAASTLLDQPVVAARLARIAELRAAPAALQPAPSQD
ncbi:MAG: 4-alpha-glucanotransferase [Janthinobacterium lividum]